jgi:hypothetical protein
MKTYAVKTEFSFTGRFIISAENEEDVGDWVEHCCGLVMGRGIHTSMSEDLVKQEFPKHAYKRILHVREGE